MYYQKLRKNLFVDIEYPQHVTELIGAAQPWQNFWTLPRETKERFAFVDDQERGDPGYRMRKRTEGREDKEYFHIFDDTADLIKEYKLENVVADLPIAQEFFDYTSRVQSRAHEFAVEIGRTMGKEIPELGALVEAGKIKSVLRLLHYMNSGDIDVIAAQHFDRSLYTLHLYESAPGLQFLNWNMEWTDAPIGTGKTVVFSGYRMEQLTGGKIQKTWHRVVKKGQHTDRVSLVLFVWADEVPAYDIHARSQELTPEYRRV